MLLFCNRLKQWLPCEGSNIHLDDTYAVAGLDPKHTLGEIRVIPCASLGFRWCQFGSLTTRHSLYCSCRLYCYPFQLDLLCQKAGGSKVILFKKRNWWWSQVACMQFSLATSPVFLNPGSIKQWEITLILAVKFLGQLPHKSTFSSCWLYWIRPFFNFLSAFELPATASAQPFLQGTHTHTQMHIHTSNYIPLIVGPKPFCPNCLHFWAGSYTPLSGGTGLVFWFGKLLSFQLHTSTEALNSFFQPF